MADDSAEPKMNEPTTSSVLEQTIATMEEAQLCFHPVHQHSFSQVSFLISGSMRKCAGCDKRLRAVLGASAKTDEQVVRCVACGAYAHRNCAMESSPEDPMWIIKCPVNSDLAEASKNQPLEMAPVTSDNKEKEDTVTKEADASVPNHDTIAETTSPIQPDSSVTDCDESTVPPRSLFQFLSPANLFVVDPPRKEDEQAPKELSVSSDDEEDEVVMLWTPDGPPRHWASEKALSGIQREATDAENDEEEEPNSPLHVANNTFATVSRALQENIIAHFIRRPFIEKALSRDQSETAELVEEIIREQDLNEDENERETTPLVQKSVIERTATTDSLDSRVDVKALLTEVKPAPVPKSPIARMASGTMEAAKTSAAMRSKMGLVYVAGGIAGGVAGLCVAGPAGAVIGAKCGQTAGLLGVILEGSMTVGVFVAGVAAGGFTARHIHEQQEKRVLTIGEDGIKRKVLLVRPNVWIDPVWESICAKARSSHPSNRRSFALLPSSKERQADIAKKERYRRDWDIVATDESEIATADKVLLLVSRSLNDKESMPGHVYKCLIEDYRERCVERDMEVPEESDPSVEPQNEADATNDLDEESNRLRARRHDAHAVIKHVTATLIEVRPGFAASPVITEMSASAVEGLVFGELYDSVFEEIVEETRASDKALMEKIRDFENAYARNNEGSKGKMISQAALDALLLLPEAHSPVDKLRYCVQFLELISVHFSMISNERSAEKRSPLGADFLLKMVCQHIIAAKVPNINAEVIFLEEFARDEQLLRGKEGYALVTLQASLHFLNASTNFDEDIFGQDDEDS